ncbi:MAG: ribbon-helix-helix protein, CopG family [Deltaproteobacteria bacterium]|nr:ribbon-helix-helix protein, CopG family [Deltaproteobacteria bacterium]
MAQLNVYLPEDLKEKIQSRAKAEGKSISAYLTEIVRREIEPKAWSPEFIATFGSWEGDFPEIEDLEPEKRDDL